MIKLLNLLKTLIFVTILYVIFNVGINVGLGQGRTTILLPIPPSTGEYVPDSPPPADPNYDPHSILPPYEEGIPEQQREEYVPASLNHPREINCLAQNMYFEDRNHGILGMLAVGMVTLNRVHDTKKYKLSTICKIVWEKHWSKKYHKYVPQFSWTLDGKSDRPKNKKMWNQAQIVAAFLVSNETSIEDMTGGALLYHATYVNPHWSRTHKVSARIGTHIFYK